MKFQTETTQLVKRYGKVFLYVEVPNSLADELNKLVTKECIKAVEVKQYREKRSITANGYMWALCDQIAKKLTIPKGDVYVKMIKRYGIYHELTMKDVVLTTLIKTWDAKNTTVEHTESLCEVTNSFRSKGILWHELNCYEGSSDYDTLKFSTLLKGIISECELIGINTMTETEINGLMANYEGSQ